MDAIKDDIRNQALAETSGVRDAIAPPPVQKPMRASFEYKKDKEGAKLLVKARLQELKNIKDVVNTKINVIGYVDHYASREMDGGELQEWRRVVVICDKGEMYDCGSLGVLRALEIIESIKEPGLWKPSIPCVVKMKTISGGKTWVWLEPDVDAIFMDEPNAPIRKK